MTREFLMECPNCGEVYESAEMWTDLCCIWCHDERVAEDARWAAEAEAHREAS